MRLYILSVLFIQLFLCLSCGNGKNELIFSESESLLDTDADSALTVLRSILNPEELSEKEQNRYALLKIQAEYKSYQDITSDSTIFSVKDYYLKKRDTHNIALSLYYCGCFYQECGNKENAMKNYLLANDYATKTNNYNLKGLILNAIGVNLLEQFDIEGAMTYFRESATLYKQAGNLKNEVVSYLQIGNCFQYLEKPDSALLYYRDCLHIVDAQKFSKEQSSVRQSIGVLYSGKGESAKAIQFLKGALAYEPDQNDRLKIGNMLAELYFENNQKDSAHVYTNYLLQQKEHIEDVYIRAELFRILSDIDERQGDYLKALENHKAYSDNLLSIIEANIDKKLLDIQKKYNYEKFRIQNVQLKLNSVYYFVYLMVSLLIISIIVFTFYRTHKLNKDKMSDLEGKVLQLKSMAESFDEKEKTFRSHLLRHFDILKKSASLEIYVREGANNKNEFWIKRINEIIYDQDTLNWDVLYGVMNELHNNFFTKLKEHYSQLGETEFRIICLTYAKFTSGEIAIILRLSLNTINTKRSVIRKKIGLEAFGNLSVFLDERLGK